MTNSIALCTAALLAQTFYRRWPFEFGKWSLWQRLLVPFVNLQSRTFVAKSLRGPVFRVDLRDYIQQRIFYFGVWEPTLTDYIVNTLKPGDTFIDVGANIGYYSCLAASVVGESGSVHSVEASPSVYRQLLANIALNAQKNIVAHQCAAASVPGRIPIYKAGSANIGQTTIRIEHSLKYKFPIEAEVRADTLDGIVGIDVLLKARLVKIDVEGAEWEVLAGMVHLLPRFSPSTEFVIEISPVSMENQGIKPAALVALFTDLGYDAFAIEDHNEPARYMERPRRRPLVPLPKEIVGQVDALFRKSSGQPDTNSASVKAASRPFGRVGQANNEDDSSKARSS
jgi:FkbM family methyltransferase